MGFVLFHSYLVFGVDFKKTNGTDFFGREFFENCKFLMIIIYCKHKKKLNLYENTIKINQKVQKKKGKEQWKKKERLEEKKRH